MVARRSDHRPRTDPGPSSAPTWARADDRRAARSHVYHGPVGAFETDVLDDVVATIERADAARRDGAWVVGFVAYEAASAFDAAFPVRRPPTGTPLVRFIAFATREPVVALTAPDAPTAPAVDVDPWTGGDAFERAVDDIRRRIARGDVYQVNLTDRVHGRVRDGSFDLYRAMALAQGGSYNVYFTHDGLSVVSASPELFFEWDGDTITARPMKGTAPRGLRALDDAAQRSRLVASEKDQAENVMIVDLLRNDLSRVACRGSVRVPALLDVERYETVWQLTSTITATARHGLALAELFAATFPCGSVTGAPKAAAMAIIDELEATPRGVYCGAIAVLAPDGHRHGPRARVAVAIRTAVVDEATGRVTYGSGGGITWPSEPAAERAELEHKVQVLITSRPAFRLLETLRLDGDGARRVDAHLDRLAASAARFGFVFDLEAARRAVDALGRPVSPRRLRLLVASDGSVEALVGDLDAGVESVRLAVDRNHPMRHDDLFCLHKTTNRGHYDAARTRFPEADDVIIVNERDQVVETTIANVLYRIGEEWFVPPLSCGGLDGVGRAELVARGEVTERALPVDALTSCDELAVVSSLRGRRCAVLLGPMMSSG